MPKDRELKSFDFNSFNFLRGVIVGDENRGKILLELALHRYLIENSIVSLNKSVNENKIILKEKSVKEKRGIFLMRLGLIVTTIFILYIVLIM